MSRGQSCESLLAQLRGVFALAISKRLREGHTFKLFAERIGWDEARFRQEMLFLDGAVRLDTISDMAFAIGFEITTELHAIEREPQAEPA